MIGKPTRDWKRVASAGVLLLAPMAHAQSNAGSLLIEFVCENNKWAREVAQ